MPSTELAAPALSLAPASGVNHPPFHVSTSRNPAWISSGVQHAAITAAPLIVADLAAMTLSFATAAFVTATLWPSAVIEWKAIGAALFCALFVAAPAVGLYPGVGLSAVSELRRAGMAAACIGPMFLAVSFFQPARDLGVQFAIVLTCGLLIPSLALFRRAARAMFGRFDWWGQPALIVGREAVAQNVYRYLVENPGIGLRPLGLVSDRPVVSQTGPTARHLAPLSRLASVARRLDRPWLIIATAGDLPLVERQLGRDLVDQVLVSRLDGSSSVWHRASACLDWPGHESGIGITPRLRPYKRAIDLTLAVLLSVPLVPLMLGIAALIKLSSPGPVIFKQERVGHQGRRFLCWKFRTMVCDGQRVLEEYLTAHPERRAEWDRDHKLQHDPRVTAIGRVLRKTSLDELPQLWNVLRGDMSLVGPRPILASEIPDFGANFEAFCSVLPGITGMWQVSGRNQTTYAEHVELDGFYARHWSLWLDLHILMMTFKVVLLRQGAC
jgi:Undecaprenyl-phosphate galactose phosphotransferase WbaP